MKKRKIGIPRALLYYYYFPFWLKLFSELDIEPVISDNTSRDLLDQGVKKSLSEICVPIKVMVGHLLNLDQKDVDYIFLPRFRSIRKDIVLCPKFLGLP
ncbi:MAG: acyl-CoA dehydratase activase-related protein, partial [Halanaerobium sp.]